MGLADELEAFAEKVDYLEAQFERVLLDVAKARAENRALRRELAKLRP